MKYHGKILIIDDEEALRSILTQRLSRKGYETFQAGTAEEGTACLKDTVLDVVLLDLKLPDEDGLTLLPKIKQLQPEIQVVMLTGHGTIESAIEAMKLGAYDYLTKPCNFSELEITLQKALEKRELLLENRGLRQVVNRQTSELKIIGKSPQMRHLLEMTNKFAQTDAPVLIQGESGVGKELFARAIHLGSLRANRPYIPLNAGAIPEGLMESELFGHEKGAFTGAGTQKIGLVEMADNGTLFLDEIGEMPLLLQVKLLRFLETGEFRRVGDTRLRRVDVRIVAATNRDLQQEVDQGNFRQDLYYRLNSLNLEVPSLRERRSDIMPLAEYFLDTQNKGHEREQSYRLSSDTKEKLLKYDFPGNVRELAHLMKRGQILAGDGIIEPSDIWPEKPKHKLNSPQLNAPEEKFFDFPNDKHLTLE
ncbi:MAG: sigma-54 dependent transcriptional regulator, partial [Dehalobacterium sp.]